jgi:hypothetical protein
MHHLIIVHHRRSKLALQRLHNDATDSTKFHKFHKAHIQDGIVEIVERFHQLIKSTIF